MNNSLDFDVSGITYDRDGNHSALTRRTETGSANTYGYSYASGSNRLSGVTKNGEFKKDADKFMTASGSFCVLQ